MRNLNVLVRIAVCLLFVFIPLHNMDEWFYDRFFLVRGESRSDEIMLVKVNDGKFQNLFNQEPFSYPREDVSYRPKIHAIWYPEFYDNLIRKIEADEPKLIVFTSFYEWVPPRSNPREHSNLLFSAYLNEENKLVPPPRRLTEKQNFGFNNVFPDLDNIVRKGFLAYAFGYSLALKTHDALHKGTIERNVLNPLWIDYRGPSGSFPSIDAGKIARDGVAPGTFRNKIVLVGREGNLFWDFETPVGKMSRLEIQANVLDTFLNNREIRIAPRWVKILLGAFTVSVSVFVILYYPITLAWIILLFFALAFTGVSLLLFSRAQIWAGIANPIFCIFGTHLLMLGFKLSIQEEEQWKIQQEAEYLKEMDRFKNNFISLFSHDLKTPIAKIKAVVDRITTANPQLPPDIDDGIKSIDRSNSELARLISDILKVTKMESMAIEPRREVLDINRLIEESIHRLKLLADEKSIRLVSDLEPLFSIEGDKQLILEVIINLLENAIKYSPPQSEVIIRTAEAGETIQVSVQDRGPGIPAEEIPRITTKFYRGQLVKNSTKGSGLGLYLSKYFVELHRGTLEIRSEVGKGTTVTFALPLES